MELKEFMGVLGRYLLPFIIAWNVYLHQGIEEQKTALAAYRLHVAENYLNKQDLENLFEKFESRFDEKLKLYTKNL